MFNAFLVGGAVRDQLLGLPVKDRDWVVVGASPEELQQAGYKAVGRDFPVFLHPTTHEEYALARTERKSAPGYHGFEFHANSDVTLEQDLERRDLTINAMAIDSDGNIIDPFGGQQDLEKRLLRHVSDAFAEDPVRILRVARLLARYATQGFTVADETMALMSTMVADGEVDALVPERVWQETHRALTEPSPWVFFETLRSCQALQAVMPEIDNLFGVPQPEKWHPEIDTGVHTLMVLQQACLLADDPQIRFAALCHDCGKALTPETDWPSHHGHEKSGLTSIRALCKRLAVPARYRDLALMACQFHTHVHTAFELKSKTLVKTLQQLDVQRKPERFEQFIIVCEADARGRTGFETRDYPQADYMREAARVFSNVNAAEIAASCQDPKDIAPTIRKYRTAAIQNWKVNRKHQP